MMDDFMIEGLGPSPNILDPWTAARPDEAASEGPPPTLEEQLENEKRRSAALEQELRAARGDARAWTLAVSSLANAFLLNPHANASHAANAEKALTNALSHLSFITALRYCNCSFPASDASRPEISLRKWVSLEESEWDMAWTPAWTAEACVDGSRGITFSTLLKISGIALAGRLRFSFAADGSRVRASFLEPPAFRCDVACQVTLGQVPLPIQAELGRAVRDEASRWFEKTMVHPAFYTVTLQSPKELDDADLERARAAARVGAERAAAGLQRWPSSPHTPNGKRR